MVCLSDFLIIKPIIFKCHPYISFNDKQFPPWKDSNLHLPITSETFLPIKLMEYMNWKLPRRRFTNPSRLWYFLALSQHSITKDTRQVDVSWWLLVHFHHQWHKTQRTSQISKDIRKLITSLYLTYILYINFKEKSIFKLPFL